MCVCTGFPGGSVAIYICVYLFICIYTHMHIWERDRERKKEWKKEKESKGKEANNKEVTHMIIQALDLQLASWRPKRPDSVNSSLKLKILRTRRIADVNSSLRLSLSENRRRSFSQPEENEWNWERKKEKMNIFLLFSFFVLVWPLNWMKPTRIGRAICFTQLIHSNVNLIQEYPHRHTIQNDI